ncbi:unnamed protein product, partial [Ectocarpus sp. 8 AP-2014]
ESTGCSNDFSRSLVREPRASAVPVLGSEPYEIHGSSRLLQCTTVGVLLQQTCPIFVKSTEGFLHTDTYPHQETDDLAPTVSSFSHRHLCAAFSTEPGTTP